MNKCQICNTEVEGRKLYCDSSECKKERARIKYEKEMSKITGETSSCPVCAKEFLKRSGKRAPITCGDRKCRAEITRQKNVENGQYASLVKEKVLCSVEGCTEFTKCKGYCNTHYAYFFRMGYPVSKNKKHDSICGVDGCDEKHRRNGFCVTHSARLFRHGDADYKIDTRIYFTEEDVAAAIKRSKDKYSKSEKGMMAARLGNQRRRQRSADHVELTVREAKQVFEQFNHECFNCGSTKSLCLDHHISLSKGGSLELGNTTILCNSCNAGKWNKDPEDFYNKEQLATLEVLHKSQTDFIDPPI